jgi:hypothetical protein
MDKKELFDKYSVDESHNVWQPTDSHMSIEIYRIMHDGKLPIPEDKSVKYITVFLDNMKEVGKFTKEIMKREDWGSLYLTAKRSVYMLHREILKEINT